MPRTLPGKFGIERLIDLKRLSGITTLMINGKCNLTSFSRKGSRSGTICVRRRLSAVEIFLLPQGRQEKWNRG